MRHGTTDTSLSRRFDDPARETCGDWRDWAAAGGEAEVRRVEVSIERPREAISRNDSPDIPFEQSFNAYRGCEHGCIYCFARPTHAFHNLSPGLDFETRLFAKPEGPALLSRAFARPGYRPSPLAMGTNTDPYQPIERRFRLTRAVLALCEETGHPVSVTTKSDRVLDDLEVLARLASRGLAIVMISLTTLDPLLARQMEPRAAAPHRRLAAIAALSRAGVPVSVSVSPLIPGLNDHELEAIVTAAAGAGAVAATALPIRLPHEVAPLFLDWLQRHRPAQAQKVEAGIRAMRGGRLNEGRFHDRHRPGGPWGALMAARMARLRRTLGLDHRRYRDLRTDLFQPPPADPRQGRLFG